MATPTLVRARDTSLITARKQAGLSLAGAAAQSGVSRAMVNFVERGIRGINIEQARSLCLTYGVRLADVFTHGDGSPVHDPCTEAKP